MRLVHAASSVLSHFECIWLPICTAEHRFSGSVMLLFIAVDMQCRETYTWRALIETRQEYVAHLHLNHTFQISSFFRHTPKMTFSSCYNKWSVGYFGLKRHRHILGTPKANHTPCKRGHNRCPLSLSKYHNNPRILFSPVTPVRSIKQEKEESTPWGFFLGGGGGGIFPL